MNEERRAASDAVIAKLREYADGRKRDVGRGLETAELAGLLVQKYGYGLADSLEIVLGGGAGGTLYVEIDSVVASVDPDWVEHQHARWDARPAGIAR